MASARGRNWGLYFRRAREGGDARPLKAAIVALASTGFLVAGLALGAAPAAADTSPTSPGEPETVTSVPLPTAQIDGVAWAQAIAGDTVFVGGEFTNARPAGAAAGVNTSPRANLMAYTLSTGVMTSWNPGANAKINAIAASDDGKTIYVGGTFTTIAGASRNRIAAFNATTGALLPWNPGANAGVTDIAVRGNTVWAVGNFTSFGGGVRARTAAVNASTGALLPYTATLTGGNGARAIVVNPEGTKVVVAGSFTSTNGSTNPGRGMAALDATTGASMPWAVNSVIRNADLNAAIYSLASDGDSVYGTGYDYGGGSEDGFEDVFRASWSDGSLVWMTDCHGDDYSVAVSSGVVYSTSHNHYCGNIGGFPQTSPKWTFHHSSAIAKDYLGNTFTSDPYGYKSYVGQPAGTMLQWYPDWQVGSYTGKSQAAWDVAANDDYVLYGGEFLRINNVAQQGLVRFAKKAIAPDTDGPQLSGTDFPVTALSLRAGEVRLSWAANYDRDDKRLTYQLFRQGVATPIYETTADSNFWTQPDLKYVDRSVTPGQTYQYRVRAIDPNGNTATGAYTTVTASSTSASAYSLGVIDDGAVDYWPLGESSGTVAANWADGGDLTVNSATRNVTGQNQAVASKATQFSGASGSFASTGSPEAGANTFSIEAWVNTTSTSGGKIVGFGGSKTGDSTSYDRHVYMDGSGRITFGVYPGGVRTVQSGTGYNDGAWHYIVATMGSDGMTLFVDGKRVDGRADTTYGQDYSGYWRVGGDNLGGWPNVGGSTYLAGSISDVAIYDKVLTRNQVDSHWVKSGRTTTLPTAPADAYGKAVFDLSPTLYWRAGEASGSTAKDSGLDGQQGTYYGNVTKGATGALSGVSDTAIALNPNGGDQTGITSNNSFTNPTTFSLETWFKTDSTSGGKIMGFGSAQTGNSSSYDRHVYMSGDGRVKFGVWTGSEQVIQSAPGFNDGQWHYVVAQMSDNGMQLYLDGALVSTSTNNQAQDYTGYWRVGGDNGWEGDQYWRGSVDEIAVYPTLLAASQVQEHWDLGRFGFVNQPPVAAFSSIATDLSVAFDGTASSDAEGGIASYAWDFGDGHTGTGATPTHVYAHSGTYQVKLTVTDEQDGSTSVTHPVSVVGPNVDPTASFTSKVTYTQVAFDATGSSDVDGSIVSYAWAFGDGQTGTGATPSHTYATAGTYTVTLTVTDDRTGSASTDKQIVTNPDPGTPGDAYGAAVYGLDPTIFWRLGDSTGSAAADSGPNDNPGAYHGDVTKGVAGALDGVTNTAITTNPSGDTQTGVVSDDSFDNPTTFAVEAWFKTDSTSGGKIVGFGNAQTGQSNNYDRHVYMTGDGRVKFGVWTGEGQIIQSDTGYNDNAWHHVVAQISSSGMQLYLDGQLVDSSANTAAQPYTGYWRVGGDSGWEGDVYWRGSIDEVAVYPTTLTAQQVDAHYDLGTHAVPNTPPTASFSSQVNGLTASFDATSSSDLDGPITAYSWDFGDGTTGTGATPTHTYDLLSTYHVTLTVTDNQQTTSSVTHDVTIVAPNEAPTAAFSAVANGLSVTVDGTASTDPEGSALTYAWDFGDGTEATGVSVTHAYDRADTYTVTLVVTDAQGNPSEPVTRQMTVSPPNEAPTAAFTATPTGLTVSVDASTSTDPEHGALTYAWDFGDGATGTGVTASHTYTTADTYTVKLVVTDDKGLASSAVTHDVTVAAPNEPPVAAFTSTTADLTVSVDASTSTDPEDGALTYEWEFGDGSTGTGVTASHTYATAGTYTVKLTVTDPKDATASKSSPVEVSAPPTSSALAKDLFERTSASGWGTADEGGAWTIGSGSAARFSVADGAGVISVNSSTAQEADLKSVSSTSTLLQTTFAVDKIANAQYIQLIGRQVGSSQYILRARIASNGSVMLYTLRNGTAIGAGVTVPGVTITPGTNYTLAFKVTGTSPTSLAGKMWKASDAEPSAWLVSRTDSTAGYQAAGSIGLYSYVPTSANAYPVKVSFADVTATDPAGAPVNQAPTAAFTSSTSGLSVSVDGSSSSDPEGGVLSYAWEFGDGATATVATASHEYASAGTYAVKLTVTDPQGASHAKTASVTVTSEPPANEAPTAAFTSSTSGLSVSVDGSSSSDPEGGALSYAWEFGDGATATGATASHEYASAGTYTVKLTVTDPQDESDAKTASVTVTAPPATSNVLAKDLFERSGSNGWGTADQGGAWTVSSGPASAFSVTGGSGVMRVSSSTALQANLGVSSANTKIVASFSVDKVATQYVTLIGRKVGSEFYSLRARVAADGTVQLYVLRGATAVGAAYTVPGLTITPGTAYTLAFEVKGVNSTALSAKMWKASDVEPTAWQVTRTDATASLQAAGTVGVYTYVPTSAAAYPVTLAFSDITVTDPTVP